MLHPTLHDKMDHIGANTMCKKKRLDHRKIKLWQMGFLDWEWTRFWGSVDLNSFPKGVEQVQHFGGQIAVGKLIVFL